MIRFIDLFGGIGGFRLGLEISNKNYQCVWYNDIKKHAVKIYNKNFHEHWKPRDITKIESNEIPDFDLVCGGFPCQSFSVSGKRKGFQDIRGTLFFQIYRIIQEKKPQLLLLENVEGLYSTDFGRCFYTILLRLEELGYSIEWQTINSANHGSAQSRKRVFIVGYLGEECRRTIFPLEGTRNKTPKMSYEITGKTPSGLSRQGDRVYSINGTSPTLTASFKPPIIEVDERMRYLTPIECERLQGFPDGWTEGVSESQRYDLLGNTVNVNVIKRIGCVLNG